MRRLCRKRCPNLLEEKPPCACAPRPSDSARADCAHEGLALAADEADATWRAGWCAWPHPYLREVNALRTCGCADSFVRTVVPRPSRPQQPPTSLRLYCRARTATATRSAPGASGGDCGPFLLCWQGIYRTAAWSYCSHRNPAATAGTAPRHSNCATACFTDHYHTAQLCWLPVLCSSYMPRTHTSHAHALSPPCPVGQLSFNSQAPCLPAPC